MPTVPGFFDEDTEDDLDLEQEEQVELEPEVRPKPGKKDEDDLEIQIVDDPAEKKRWKGDPAKALEEDPNDKDYGQKVQTRIKKLTAAAKETARQRDAEAKAKAELLAYAKAQNAKIAELERRLVGDNANSVASQISGAEAEAALASNEYALAAANADALAMSKANAKLTAAQVRESQAKALAAQLEARKAQAEHNFQKATKEAAEVQQLVNQPEVPEQPESRLEWFQKNPWFKLGSPDPKSQYAIYLDSVLKDKGIEADSEEYFEKLDEGLRNKFPSFFGVDRKKSSVAVHTERRDPDQRTKVIQGNKLAFTKSQIQRAKELGLYGNKKAMYEYAKRIEEANERYTE